MRLVPLSSQIRNAAAYIAITLLAVLFLNIYSSTTTRELMFKAKYASVLDKTQVVVSSFSGMETLNPETVGQVISVLGDMNVTRLIVTNHEGRALYDSSEKQNAVGRLVVLREVVQALEGNDVFNARYEKNGALISFAAMPIFSRDEIAGCVYVMEYDAEQGGIIGSLENNILRGSLILLAAIFICAVLFTFVGSMRMQKILTSVRLAREGEYSHKVQMRGSDEYSRLAREFNKLTDRLNESEQTQRQFVSDASHELKTPLASIKLLSDSILQNEMDVDTMREFVADIGNESDRLTRMTNKLLTLSKAEDAIERERAVIDLREVVSRVFRMLVPLSEEKTVRLTASLAENCTVLSCEDDLYQIVFNLVENGIKYNRPGGSVHATVERREDDVLLSIQDTGMGIPEKAVSHIFERFYRVDKARSRQAGGAGLGLAIVHELVQRNYGTIEVSSKEGEGTLFTACFPFFELSEEVDHEQ